MLMWSARVMPRPPAILTSMTAAATRPIASSASVPTTRPPALIWATTECAIPVRDVEPPPSAIGRYEGCSGIRKPVSTRGAVQHRELVGRILLLPHAEKSGDPMDLHLSDPVQVRAQVSSNSRTAGQQDRSTDRCNVRGPGRRSFGRGRNVTTGLVASMVQTTGSAGMSVVPTQVKSVIQCPRRQVAPHRNPAATASASVV
jgi:hypothetical protein